MLYWTTQGPAGFRQGTIKNKNATRETHGVLLKQLCKTINANIDMIVADAMANFDADWEALASSLVAA